MEEAKANYEGFSSGVRAILRRKSIDENKRIDGVRDVLANFLNVQKGYETAIESAFGNYLQAIVVDTVASAKNAIFYLKQNSCGRASFMHLGFFNERSEDSGDRELKDHRVLGRAIDFVSVDSNYANVVKFLLRNVFIVRDIDDIDSILKGNASFKECTFITLLGEVAVNGFISGGDISKEGINLINRDGKIREFSEIIKGLEENLQKIEEERLRCEKEKSTLEKRLEGINRRLNEKEIADFKEFWVPRMAEQPYYFVTFVSQEALDEYAPLTVYPEPDSVIRVYFDHRGLDAPIDVAPQELETPERYGFSVVEWGGNLYR